MILGLMLLLSGYATVVALPIAMVTWGAFQRLAAATQSRALTYAAIVWLSLVGPPAAGLVVDWRRYPVECGVGGECFDYILWLFGMAIGWVLAPAAVAVALVAEYAVRRGRRMTGQERPPASR